MINELFKLTVNDPLSTFPGYSLGFVPKNPKLQFFSLVNRKWKQPIPNTVSPESIHINVTNQIVRSV